MQRSPILKLIAVFGCSFVILIALMLVGSVVSDRQAYRDQAVASISQSYAGAQTVVGPVLVRPYVDTVTEPTVNENGKLSQPKARFQYGNYIVYPSTLRVEGELKPSLRRHGLYSVPVYELQAHMEGDLDVPTDNTEHVEMAQPYLAFALSDFRGIVGMPSIKVDGVSLIVAQSNRVKIQRAAVGGDIEPLKIAPDTVQLIAPLPMSSAKGGRMHVAMDFALAGTQSLKIAPVADMNEIHLKSSWPAPLFAGAFLPRTREVSGNGFDARWQISALASSTQVEMPAKLPQLISVDLLNSIDPYKMSDRATKYGILFVLLTFGSFFVFEVMKQSPIHPVQYLLVGFALVVFFLLLVSFSEHMPFGLAYLIASIACIGLITFYLTYVLKGVRYGLGFGVMLTALYATVYGLLLSEDNALLLGAVMLFVMLAVAMYITRHVDWYRVSQSSAGGPGSAPAQGAGGLMGGIWSRQRNQPPPPEQQ